MRLFLIFLQIVSGIFYTKIINTPVISKKILQHHVILLQQNQFTDNQTMYNNIYAIDFCPCGNFFEIISKRVPGKIRIFYINNCKTSDIYETIINETKKNETNDFLYEIRDIDIELFNKIKSWEPTFHLYTRNCQHFSSHITKEFKNQSY